MTSRRRDCLEMTTGVLQSRPRRRVSLGSEEWSRVTCHVSRVTTEECVCVDTGDHCGPVTVPCHSTVHHTQYNTVCIWAQCLLYSFPSVASITSCRVVTWQVMRPGAGWWWCWLELQTKVREDFTITEKAHTGPPPSWKCLLTLSHLTLSCRWVDISTWTPPPQDCLYLGPSPSVLNNSFFAESSLTCYNFLASLQINFNQINAHIKFFR